MNDEKTDGALKEILDELSSTREDLDSDYELEELEAIEEIDSTGDMDEIDFMQEDGRFSGFADDDLEGTDFTGFQIDDEQVDTVTDADTESGGFNWAGLLWAVILVAASAALIYTEVQESGKSQSRSELLDVASDLGTDANKMGHQALLASTGATGSFEQVQALREQMGQNLARLSSSDSQGLLPNGDLESANRLWRELVPELDILLDNRDAVEITTQGVSLINELTPVMLEKTDEVVNTLIDSKVDINLVNLASRQRFLSQRIKANMNEFALGAPGWEQAATRFGLDVKIFGQITDALAEQGGGSIAAPLEELSELYGKLVNGADGAINNVGNYFAMRNSADRITETSDVFAQLVNNFRRGLNQPSGTFLEENLRWILLAIILLSLIFLFWSTVRYQRRKAQFSSLKTQVSEDAVIKLLDEMGDLAQGDLTVQAEVTDEVTGAIADSVNFAVSEMRVLVEGIKSASLEVNDATESTESLIAQLLVSSDAQSDQIVSASKEVTDMTSAINLMSETALQSSRQARVSAEVAQKGASAVRKTVQGMTTTRNQIQDTAKRLKRLGESSQQINEIVNLIQDVTEQTNVLSLNASIQAAMAGEAGRGFAVVAEEVQRLAERSARSSNEITELVKNIQQDVNNAIVSMETTTEEVVSGARMADEAGQALNEIESMSQELLRTIDQVANDAQKESKVAQTVAERMETLNAATKESDMSVSQVAVSLEQMRAVADRLNQSISGFKLPSS